MTLAGLLSGCQNNPSSFWRRLDQSDNWVGALIEPIMPPTPSQAARDMFNVYDADARRKGISLISGSPFGGEDAYLRAYRLLVDDPSPVVRGTVAQALGVHGGPEDAPDLIRMLKDDSKFVRWQAASALGKIYYVEASEPLIVTLQDDEDLDARASAAYALGQYAQVPVFDALVGALNDRDFGVVDSASRSLYLLTGQYKGTDGREWLRWATDNRGALFANQQVYNYEPYPKPKPYFWWLTFWRDYSPPNPMLPAGSPNIPAQSTGATPVGNAS